MQIGVTTTTPMRQDEARILADRLGLVYCDDPTTSGLDYLLVLTPDYLGLHKTNDKHMNPFHIDFLSGKMRYRSNQAGLRKELIARAMGVKPTEHPLIIDATAGLGRDSFILATLGFNITLIERSPILYALLRDGLQRAKNEPSMASIIDRMELIQADAIDWLKQYSGPHKPDVIYLDPMFPGRQKSASVKKEMVFLQELLGKDTDASILFEMALSCAGKRVVVKRPRLAANISERAPNFSLEGKSSRFDIYLT